MSDDEEEGAKSRREKAFKICLVGDGSSGKTSIINRYAQQSFGKEYRQTVGLDFFSKRLTLPGDIQVMLQIWDIGGQSLGGKMVNNYIENAHCIVFVYDITNSNSFDNLPDWIKLVKRHFQGTRKPPHLMIMGNKIDLSHMRQVSQLTHETFATGEGMASAFVCAKTGDAVAGAFRKIVTVLTGIQPSKSEDVMLTPVLRAGLVDHPNAPPVKMATKVAPSKMCTLQ